MNRHFSKEVQTANKYMKKYSTPLDIRKIQTKTALKLDVAYVYSPRTLGD